MKMSSNNPMMTKNFFMPQDFRILLITNRVIYISVLAAWIITDSYIKLLLNHQAFEPSVVTGFAMKYLTAILVILYAILILKERIENKNTVFRLNVMMFMASPILFGFTMIAGVLPIVQMS